MDRVIFLMEDDPNVFLECLLNPERLLLHRDSGVGEIESINGPLCGVGTTNNPVIFRGGGVTELELYLLFDIDLQASTQTYKDVRQLTKPLWDLTKVDQDIDPSMLPIARFIWGKSWNIPGAVMSLAENLENFTPTGVPQRSWLSMRFREVDIRHRKSTIQKKSFQTPNNKTINIDEWRQSVTEFPAMHFLTGGTFGIDGDNSLDDRGFHDQNEIIEKVLAGNLGLSVKNTIKSSKSLLGDLWERLSESDVGQVVQSAFDSTMIFITDLGNAKGSRLVENYNKAHNVLEKFVGEVESALTGTVIPFAGGLLQDVKTILSDISKQASQSIDAGKQILSKLELIGYQILSDGVSWANKAVDIIQGVGKQTLQEIEEFSDISLPNIQARLEELTKNTLRKGRKNISFLVDSLAKQLSKLPNFINQAWKNSKKPVAKLAESLLDAAVHAIGLFRSSGMSLQFAEEQSLSPVELADCHIIQLQTEVSKPAAERDTNLIQKQVDSLKIIMAESSLAQDEGFKQKFDNFIEMHSEEGLEEVSNLLSRVRDELEDQRIQHDCEVFERVRQASLEADSFDKRLLTRPSERLDQLAFKYFGEASFWRRLAYANDIADPLRLSANLILKIPNGV